MPTLDDIYRKFGEASEAAQLIETSLGNLLIRVGATAEGLLDGSNPMRARELVEMVDSQTLGQLLRNASQAQSIVEIERLLQEALKERNRLTHSFFRQHNLRRNSEEGRALMMTDLESIHSTLLEAFKALLKLEGVDVESLSNGPLPNRHLPI